MGDPRRFWKERVGVLPSRPGADRPEAGSRTRDRSSTPGSAAPAGEKDGIIPLATRPPDPGQSNADLADSTLSGLASALPTGSAEFSRAVSLTLWGNPSDDDLARLARLVASWRDLPNDALREAATLAVSLRLRMKKLSASAPAADIDADTWSLRGAEYLRIASDAERLATRLDAFDGRPGAETARAARELLPEPRDLRAHSALCSETASLIETALLGGRKTAWRPIAAADALLAAIETGTLEPGELRHLQLYAACSAAQRDIQAGGREGLLRARRLLAILAGAIGREDGGPSGRGAMDAASIRRRAWHRLLADTRVRVDEHLTRPQLCGSSTLPPGPSAGRGHPLNEEARDAALLAHLRRVRAEARRPGRRDGTDAVR